MATPWTLLSTSTEGSSQSGHSRLKSGWALIWPVSWIRSQDGLDPKIYLALDLSSLPSTLNSNHISVPGNEKMSKSNFGGGGNQDEGVYSNRGETSVRTEPEITPGLWVSTLIKCQLLSQS